MAFMMGPPGGGGGSFGGGGQQRMGMMLGQAPGMPFAGIPPELQEMAEEILRHEPADSDIPVSFSHWNPDPRPFTLRRFLAPHWGRILLGIALVGIETISLQAGPLLTQIGIDRGVLKRNFGWILTATLLYFGSIVVSGFTGFFRVAYTGRLGERLMYQLRVRVFSHLQRLSLDYYTDEKAGRVMTRMTSDIEALSILFQEGIINLAVQGLTLVFVLVVIFSMNVKLAFVVVLGILPLMFALTMWFRSASDKAYHAVRDRIADVMADLQESLSGIRIVAAHNRQRHNVVRHRNVVGDHMDANLDGARAGAIYGPGIETVGTIGQALVLVVGGRMALSGGLSIGELVAFVLYLNSFFAPIQQLVQLYNTYQQGQAAVTKLRELLGTEPSVPEAIDAYELPPIEGGIVLDRATFGYDPAVPVLSDIDLTIEPGETFAFVGQTGAGKSTIAKLVARFYDPTGGRVVVDGRDIRDVTIKSLRSQLGVVPQEPYLFAGTIRDNIAFARPDASDEEVMEACRAVGIDELVGRLGLDAPVHERGSSLSSGERQLLALARAFMAAPRVLILDEATSNLDLKSEATIERALDVLLEGRTAIIIAHRLTTAMKADRIAVIHDGRLVELGSHYELVAMGGRYADMYATWTRHMSDPHEAIEELVSAG